MEKVKKIYLSGPITGRNEDQMYLHFSMVRWRLRVAAEKRGMKVHLISPDSIAFWGLEWDSYMQIARTVLKDPTIDAICLMKGWERSAGCIMELMWAREADLPIIYENGAKHA